jgi:hypothetical protein
VRNADGWITTPTDFDIDDKVKLLRTKWADGGRDGEPEVVALAGRPDAEVLAHWDAIGVSEVLFGLPDRSAEDVAGYIAHLGTKLGLTPAG